MLPLIMPAFVVGWMLAFSLLRDDLGIVRGVKPEINAVCTIMIALAAQA